MLACVYAQSKCYKTSLYLGAPKEWRPMAVLDTDRGARIRLQMLSMTPEQRKSVGIQEPVDEYFGPWIREGISFFYPDAKNWYEDCWKFATEIAPKYTLSVVDTLTHMAIDTLKEVKGIQYSGTSGATKRVHLKSGSIETVHPTMSDFGFSQDRVMEFITALDSSSGHTLLVSHEKTGEIKDTNNMKRIIGGPRTIGNALLEIIPSLMDVCLRIEPQGTGSNIKLAIRTKNHNFFIAGDRSGLFRDGETLDVQTFWKKLSGIVEMSKDDKAGTKQPVKST